MSDRIIPTGFIAVPIMVMHLAATMYGIYLTSFVDERFESLAIFVGFLLFLTLPAGTVLTATTDGVPIPRRKPRGWRKMRREAEERAYVRDLEKELGL